MPVMLTVDDLRVLRIMGGAPWLRPATAYAGAGSTSLRRFSPAAPALHPTGGAEHVTTLEGPVIVGTATRQRLRASAAPLTRPCVG